MLRLHPWCDGMKKITAAALAVLLLVLLPGCGETAAAPTAGQQRYKATFLDLFDTATTVVGYAEHEDQFTEDAQFVHDALEEYHQLYDIYNDYDGIANLKTVNAHAGMAPVKVDRRIIDLLLEARRMEQLTGGTVNVAMGSVLSIWHEYREAGIRDPAHAALPTRGALLAAAQHTDISGLIIDEDASTVYLADPEMSLDVGAIAKGYATQRVTDACRERGIDSLLISVGGNVCALGRQAGTGKPWTVAVQDPADEEKYLHTLAIADQTLVTSGSYQRYYTVEGARYHHIIDPATLMPSAYCDAVTILAADSGDADALSTALFNLPYAEGAALIAQLDGVEAMWVEKDGTQRLTDGFAAALLDGAQKEK